MKQTRTLIGALAFAYVFVFVAAAIPFPAAAQSRDAGSAVQSQAVEKSWTGMIEEKTLQGEKVYVFTIGGQSYPVEPQENAAAFVGKTVKITGKVEENKIVISDIEEA